MGRLILQESLMTMHQMCPIISPCSQNHRKHPIKMDCSRFPPGDLERFEGGHATHENHETRKMSWLGNCASYRHRKRNDK